ncbi:NME/NM23 family member 5 [Caligus rogercresseyi]|uniref:NME/NM23 family member 5 n=1 Tax=Caligus rogercresseyi TaxID=217165 RepID=A0A7T8GRZ8_CALRO|nr:NME/NM23 family member 5 [Caligus rogercresseyi]
MFKFFESRRKEKAKAGSRNSSLEGTFALIKPDAFAKREEIVQIIRTEGFLIVAARVFTFSKITLAKCFGKAWVFLEQASIFFCLYDSIEL